MLIHLRGRLPLQLLLCARNIFGLLWPCGWWQVRSCATGCPCEKRVGSFTAKLSWDWVWHPWQQWCLVKGKPNTCPGWKGPAQDWLPAVGSRRANGNSPPCGSD